MKAAGCILLLCACGGLGLGAAGKLRARWTQLRTLVAALEEMERELQYRLTPLPELLAGLAARTAGPVGIFFSLCVREMDKLEEQSFSRLWGGALEGSGLDLEEEDRRLLLELGASLGRYDSRSQCQAIAQVRGRLEENLAAALERKERLGRVYGVLGLAAGALLVILLA